MKAFTWITAVLAFLIIALVFSLNHFGKPVIKHVTVTKIVVVGNSVMNAKACQSIKLLESEAEVHAQFGSAPNGGRSLGARTLWMTYAYDSDFYDFGGPDQECDVFYGPQHRVSTVWEELIP